jgi:hypothetical protein
MWWPSPFLGHPSAPIVLGAHHLPGWYYIGLVVIVGGFWLAAYVLAIVEAMRSGRNGIPAIAVGLNIAWELNDSLLVDHSAWQRPFNFVWFLLDLFIARQVLMYGPKDYPEMSRTQFRRFFLSIAMFAMVCIPAFELEIHDYYGAYSGLVLNDVMSLAFILMLRRRGSSAGQSMYIALSKQVGSLLAVVMSVSLYPHSYLIPVMCATLVIFDMYYSTSLYKQIRAEGASPWALRRPVPVAGREAGTDLVPAGQGPGPSPVDSPAAASARGGEPG